MTRIVRAASESDAFASYMQLCTYSTASERESAELRTEAEVSNDVVWQPHPSLRDL